MKGSIRIARLAGIDVFLHWTFLILVVWIGGVFLMRGDSLAAALVGAATLAGLFTCVVLHELGHALMARRFGIQTEDITLLPIGGVARLERMPRKPMQEFLVAVAGPAVNVIIAACLVLILLATGTSFVPEGDLLAGRSFLANLLAINIMLVLFNLLPAFPMDGGRVLRALLATRMTYVGATQAAVRVGQFMALLFAIFGLLYNPFLLFIALFVYFGAAAELRMAQMTELIGALPVSAAMMTRFRELSPDDTLGDAAHELIEGYQDDFPICDGERFLGILRRADLTAAIAEHGEEKPVVDFIHSHGLTASEDDSLEELAMSMQQQSIATVPVLRGEKLLGIVSAENVHELLMLRSARSQRLDSDPQHDSQRFAASRKASV